MDVATKNDAPVSFKSAFLLEKEGDLSKAVLMYEKLLKKAPEDMMVLTRLMILSRKLKKYAQEISFINKAMCIYEQRYEKLKTKDAKVALLSKKLNTSLGHTDKRGKNLLEIPEVEKLKKRKAVATKRRK